MKSNYVTIEETANVLSNNVNQVNSNTDATTEAKQNINVSMQEMATAIQEEASNFYSVNETMIASLERVREIQKISKGIEDKSAEMNEKVDNRCRKIAHVNNQIRIVMEAIMTAATTVSELQLSIEQVNRLLDIKLISEISVYFDSIKETFDTTDTEIKKGINQIHGITVRFIDAQKQIENMASVSEENAAPIEGILATSEDESEQILMISKSIKQINQICEKLKAIVHTKQVILRCYTQKLKDNHTSRKG